MSVAAARNPAPAPRENARIANAIAKAAAAWSLGNDGSGDGADRRCVAAGWAANGRGRSQTCAMTWLATIAIAAAVSAEVQASFHLGEPYGRARNQSAIVASAYSGTAMVASAVIGSSSHSRVATPVFSVWNSDQSMLVRVAADFRARAA